MAEIEEVRSMLKRLQPHLPKEEYGYVRWVHTPDGSIDYQDWCERCGAFKARHLRKHAKKHRDDVFLDGGWLTEEDSVSCCCSCGVPLAVSLLDEGIATELGYFFEDGFTNDSAYDAYVLTAILDQLDFQRDNESSLIAASRKEALDLAAAFLSQLEGV